MQTVGARMSPEEADALRRWAEDSGATISDALRVAARSLIETTPGPAGRRGPDEATGRLGVLLDALDGVGLAGQLGEARRLLARAEQLTADAGRQEQGATAERRALVDALAAGTATPERVATRLAVTSMWLGQGGQGVTPAWAAVHSAVAQLRREAVSAARGDMLGVHRALAGRAAVVVKRAVEHGRRLVDCKRLVKLLEPPPIPPRQGNGPRVHPWVHNPPTLPTVSLDAIQGDSGRLVAWGEASSAYAEYRRIVEVADLLHAAGGPASAVLAVEHDRDVLGIVEGQLPELVHLAVFEALGWRPGLYASLKPRPRTPAGDVRPQWAPPRPVKVGPNGQGW